MNIKGFKTLDEQIEILQSRGLIINDIDFAKYILSTENYYNVINGYKSLFIDLSNKESERFLPQTTFKEIFSLYEFDQNLRILFLKFLFKIENMIKTNIAYVFSQKYGHDNYLKYENFDLSGNKSYHNVGLLITNLHRDIADQIDKNKSVTHYIKHHGYIPPWVLVNILTFGRISKFYSNMKQSDRQQVSKNINKDLMENDLKNYLEFLSIMRNLCAHGERFYNYKCHVKLKNNNFYKKLNYNNKNDNRNNIFALLVSLKALLSKEDFDILINEISSLLSQLEKNLNSISLSKITDSMGFIENWKEILS